MTTKEVTYQDIEFGAEGNFVENKDFDWSDIICFDFTKWWKDYRTRKALRSLWYDRNVKHGDVFIETMEIKTITFQQSIFVEESGDLMFKLGSLGFKPLKGFPDEGHYEAFSHVMFWQRHNIALSIYNKVNEQHIKNSIATARLTTNDSQMQKDIFVNTMKVLLANK